MIPDMPQTRQCQSADTFCKAKNQKTKGRYVFNWGGGGGDFGGWGRAVALEGRVIQKNGTLGEGQPLF